MDKRRYNGGNSTKALNPEADKRMNQYKDVLKEAASKQDIIKIIQMVVSKAINEQDLKAAQIVLDYYLTKASKDVDSKAENDLSNVPYWLRPRGFDELSEQEYQKQLEKAKKVIEAANW